MGLFLGIGESILKRKENTDMGCTQFPLHRTNSVSNYCSTPTIPGSPTDWTNLYIALKIVQGINVSQSNNHKTIVSLDLQLYSKCIKLQSREDIKHHFVFRLGELHILFAMLEVIGKNINQSGLDEALVEAGVYGPNTLEQGWQALQTKLQRLLDHLFGSVRVVRRGSFFRNGHFANIC